MHLSFIVWRLRLRSLDLPDGEDNNILTGRFADDPAAPIFFLSYARANPMGRASPKYEVSESVTKLFSDLTDNVAELFPALPGKQLGFMDRTMEGGEDWRRRLLHAAGSCQVFIALLSTKYVDSSPWCAMEWDLFSSRSVIARPPGTRVTRAIIPVLWAPIAGTVPKPISAVQRFTPADHVDPRHSTRYRASGIFGLLRTDLDAYMSIVWELALLVQKVHYAQWVEPRVPTTTRGLRRSFRRARP
jgi:hypothetical protein